MSLILFLKWTWQQWLDSPLSLQHRLLPMPLETRENNMLLSKASSCALFLRVAKTLYVITTTRTRIQMKCHENVLLVYAKKEMK